MFHVKHSKLNLMKAVYLIKDLVDNTYLNSHDLNFSNNVYFAAVFSTRQLAEKYILEDCEDIGDKVLTVIKIYGL